MGESSVHNNSNASVESYWLIEQSIRFCYANFMPHMKNFFFTASLRLVSATTSLSNSVSAKRWFTHAGRSPIAKVSPFSVSNKPVTAALNTGFQASMCWPGFKVGITNCGIFPLCSGWCWCTYWMRLQHSFFLQTAILMKFYFSICLDVPHVTNEHRTHHCTTSWRGQLRILPVYTYNLWKLALRSYLK